MNTKNLMCCTVATALGLVAGSVGGSPIPILDSADAHIDGTFPGVNFGTLDVLAIKQTALGGNKAYILFDASGWGTTNLARVETLRLVWSGSTSITRTLAISLITGTGANDWTETEITWENAPGNNVTGTDRNFGAYPDQTVTRVGTIQYSAGNPRELLVPFAEGSMEESALLAALNTGDRKATIGVSYSSSQSTAVGVYSREREEGIYTPTLEVVPEVPPGIPVTFLAEPQAVSIVSGPYKTVSFSAEAYGSAPIMFQWLTNGVVVDGATEKTLTLPAETTDLNGTLVSVLIDNDATPDPGIVSSNALLTIVEAPTPDGIIQATADVYFANTTINNAYTPASGQIIFGLAATGGASLTGPNRSYIGFTLGAQPVSKATLKLFQFWGGPLVNGSGKLAQGTFRVFGSTNELTILEPPAGTSQAWPDNPEYAAPDNENFEQVSVGDDQVVGPGLGWYEWDITDFYNANLGKQTVIRLGGVQTSGYDYPLFEDRENTAYNAGAGGTWPNSGPRIEYFYLMAPPQIESARAVDGQLVIAGSGGQYVSQTFYVLSSPDPGLPFASWTSIATNQFGADGKFSLELPIGAGGSSFYILQVP